MSRGVRPPIRSDGDCWQDPEFASHETSEDRACQPDRYWMGAREWPPQPDHNRWTHIEAHLQGEAAGWNLWI